MLSWAPPLRQLCAALPPRLPCRLLHACPAASAGHSKWAKIAKGKGVADAARARLISRHLLALTAAARAGDALRLQSCQDRAKRDDVPAAVIARAMTKASERSDEVAEEMVYEGVGPSSVSIIVDALTTSRTRAAKTIRAAFNKYGGEMAASGAVSWAFSSKGRFTVALKGSGAVAQEALLAAALEAEAEDVVFDVEEEAEEGSQVHRDNERAYVLCDPTRLGTVRNALSVCGYAPLVSEVVREPASRVEVPDGEASETFREFLARLMENEDVQAVWHNAA